MNESLKYEVMVITTIEIQKKGRPTNSAVQNNNWHNYGYLENHVFFMILLTLQASSTFMK